MRQNVKGVDSFLSLQGHKMISYAIVLAGPATFDGLRPTPKPLGESIMILWGKWKRFRAHLLQEMHSDFGHKLNQTLHTRRRRRSRIGQWSGINRGGKTKWYHNNWSMTGG